MWAPPCPCRAVSAESHWGSSQMSRDRVLGNNWPLLGCALRGGSRLVHAVRVPLSVSVTVVRGQSGRSRRFAVVIIGDVLLLHSLGCTDAS